MKKPAILLIMTVVMVMCTGMTDITAAGPSKYGLVDERYELVALVFRLAGRPEYSDTYTEYQREIAKTFLKYSNHSAVTYAKDLPFGYDAVFRYAMYIDREGSGFILKDDLSGLFDGRWNECTAKEFTKRLNQFFRDSGFDEFFQMHAQFYEHETMKYNAADSIDYDWFRRQGKTREQLAVVISPSNTRHSYSASVGDNVYVLLQGNDGAIIHEFCHSFANSIAHNWYDTDPCFRELCDESVNLQINPQYGDGRTMSGEYVTRAYTILYYKEQGYRIAPLLSREKQQGFPEIEVVYSMIDTAYRPNDYGGDWIAAILETKDYVLGDAKSITFESRDGKRTIVWRLVSSADFSIEGFSQTEVGNVFKSNTGDVLLVDDSYLLVDLGETTFNGNSGYRSYCRISRD